MPWWKRAGTPAEAGGDPFDVRASEARGGYQHDGARLLELESPSGIVVKQCQARRFRMLLSRPVLAEYRRVLRYARIVGQHRAITPAAVEDVLEKLQYLSDFPSLRLVIFRCDRDPSDEKFIELAIAGSAAYIVTRDRDLLARGSDHSDASKRFRRRLPAARIVRPEQLLAKWNN